MSTNNVSDLVTYYGSDCQKSNARGLTIKKITIHHLAMVGSCETIQNVIQTKNVSWNYGISTDGKIGSYVSENRRAWSGDPISNDDIAVTIVVANSFTDSSYPISESAYSSLLTLCEDICKRNKISKLVYVKDNPDKSTLTLHCQFNNSIKCPGNTIKSRVNQICSSVNRRLQKSSSDNVTTKRSIPSISTYDAIASNVIVLNPAEKILKQKFTPYVVTVSKNVKNIDIVGLRNNKVSAVFLHAGELYNQLHINQHKYEAPNLASQMHSVTEYDFPHGLIATVRSRSITEAKEECKWLHLVVEKYPADLGVWLACEFSNIVSVNNQILDVYLDNFKKWGIDTKCGLYITRQQLAKIDWKTYQLYYYLWLVDHSSQIPDLNTIIDPSFFDV